MKNNIKSTIIRLCIFPLLLFAALSTVLSQELVRDGLGYKTEVTHEIKTSPKGHLELSSIVGDVTVDSWGNNVVRIVEEIRIDVYTKGEAEEIFAKYTLTIEEKGRMIIARGPKRHRGYVDIDYHITLPEKYSAEIHTSGGEFDVSDLKGEYRFKTSGGDVEISSSEGKIECSTSGGDLELRSIKGTLSASTSGGDIVCVDCGDDLELKTSGGELELKRLKGELYAKTSGGDILLESFEGNCEVKTSGGEIELRQIVSKDLIDANTSGGDIVASNIVGDLKVNTSGGDIYADKVEGNLEANTSGGDIEIEDISGNVDAHTSGGDVEIKKVLGYVEAVTSGGDVEVEEVDGYVEAGTSGGDVEVSIRKYIPKTDQHIDMESSGGDLVLELPSDFKGSVKARINVEGEDIDEFNIVSDFPLKIITESDESESKKKRKLLRWRTEGVIIGEGDINGGGNLIFLETTNGNIYIKKK